MDHITSRNHLLQPGWRIGAGIQRPDRDILFADKQALVAVIGNATFRLAVDLELAHLLALDPPGVRT